MGTEFGGNPPNQEPTSEEQHLYWHLAGQAAMTKAWRARAEEACLKAGGIDEDPDRLVEILYSLRDDARRDSEEAERQLKVFLDAHGYIFVSRVKVCSTSMLRAVGTLSPAGRQVRYPVGCVGCHAGRVVAPTHGAARASMA